MAFDRFAVAYLGRGARPAAVVFAVSTVVPSAIGQWPFLAGEALGLWACWAATRNRWAVAAALAVGASLMSPLAGAFVAMAMVAGLLAGSRPAGRRGPGRGGRGRGATHRHHGGPLPGTGPDALPGG